MDGIGSGNGLCHYTNQSWVIANRTVQWKLIIKTSNFALRKSIPKCRQHVDYLSAFTVFGANLVRCITRKIPFCRYVSFSVKKDVCGISAILFWLQCVTVDFDQLRWSTDYERQPCFAALLYSRYIQKAAFVTLWIWLIRGRYDDQKK